MPGAPPGCQKPDCPGHVTPEEGRWRKVWRRRWGHEGEELGRQGGVGFLLNRAQRDRSEKDGEPEIQTVAERIRRPTRGTEIDERPYNLGLPLATIRHVLMECEGTGAAQETDGLSEVLGRAVQNTDDKPAAAKANRVFRKARAALLSA